jgi:hypothetical protein
MEALFRSLEANPYILVFLVVGLAVDMRRGTVRGHGPAREAAKEINSSVPWIGFPVGYAVSGVLLTVFGYLAMVLS